MLFSDVVFAVCENMLGGKANVTAWTVGREECRKIAQHETRQAFPFSFGLSASLSWSLGPVHHELDIVRSSPAGGTKRQIDSAGLTVQSSSLVPFHPLPPKTTTTHNNNNNKQ